MHCPARLQSAGASSSTTTSASSPLAPSRPARQQGSTAAMSHRAAGYPRVHAATAAPTACCVPHRSAGTPAPSPWLASHHTQCSANRASQPSSSCSMRRRGRASVSPAASSNGHSANSTPSSEEAENVVIVGSGPAGYTAAIYAARANLKPIVFEGFQNGRGGQLMGTTEVENFPGFPEGVTGPELMDKMRKQAERWGAELYTEDVDSIDLDQRPFTIQTSERTVRTQTIIMATGATAIRLGLPSEVTFWGKGISACAICDGASPLFKNRVVAVVGGGDSACEEAVYLTKYTKHVHLLVRKESLRASKAMQDRTLQNPKVTVHFNTAVEDVYGDAVMHGLRLLNSKTGERQDLEAAGLFYGIGHKPNSGLLGGRVQLDEKGYVKVEHGVSTNVEGLFAAGDLHDSEWRQAITAAGSGCKAALSAERYLTEHGLVREFKGSMDSVSDEHGAAEAAADEARGAANGHHATAAAGAATTAPAEESFDINQDKHKGQFALRKLYHASDRLIAVLFTAPSCGPCRSLKPILNGVVDEYPGRIHYVEIDIEADSEIAEAAGVMGTPTLQLFKDKALLATLPGVKLKREYRSIINEILQLAPVPV